jgi:hypothetical protein
LGQADGDRPPDPAARAGDERYFGTVNRHQTELGAEVKAESRNEERLQSEREPLRTTEKGEGE